MKAIIISLSILIYALSAQAQSEPLPEKGDNVIIIKNNMKSDSSYNIVSKELAERGYTFETRDKDISQIVTSPKSYAGAYSYKLIILCLENSIKIKASFNIMDLTQKMIWIDWKYNNTLGDNRRKAFNAFFPDIQKLSWATAGEIIFKKE